ncbi:MAG: methylmalonyl Co-A mutase-associated GTPase MeaB [Candidatus Aminicenantes bacterium]|jgi:LAO/AO transport system kinase
MCGIHKEILKGNPKAVAKGISLVENGLPEAQEVLKAIFPHTGGSTIIGVTGSPGVGKSTLVDQLIGRFLEKRKKIGIVAVDPSSPFSGGAILGDRIRMMRHSTDPEVFIRSMATRGHLGGLAKASGETISILEASGKDVILVETVGVGQDEVEVVKLADIVLVVLIPGVGDEIQTFKAGLMEIADIFVLNKADSPETEKTERLIKAMLELGIKKEKIPPVVRTVSTVGKGISLLLEEIEKLIQSQDLDIRKARRKKLLSWMLRDIITAKVYQKVMESFKPEDFENLIDSMYKKEIDPYTVADEFIDRLRQEKKT